MWLKKKISEKLSTGPSRGREHFFLVNPEKVRIFAIAYACDVSQQEKHCYFEAHESHAFLIVEQSPVGGLRELK
ncbi:MAG: hypothetical protein IKJ78_06645 [Bacteroidales bacterium]|nr:hypothetical protein [Bacteroidales bacterium]